MLGFVQGKDGTEEGVLDHWELAQHFSPVHLDQTGVHLNDKFYEIKNYFKIVNSLANWHPKCGVDLKKCSENSIFF